MARSYAKVLTSIWEDHDFRALDTGAQRLYLVLLSQPELSPVGTLPLKIKLWATLAPDTTPAKTAKALRSLEANRFVLVDRDTDEVWIRSFMRHDGVLTQPNIFKSACRTYAAVHSLAIRMGILGVIPAAMRNGFPHAYLDVHPQKIKAELTAALDAEPQPQQHTFHEAFPEPFRQGFREPLPEGSLDHYPKPETLSHNPSPPPKSSPPLTAEPASGPGGGPPGEEETLKATWQRMATCDLRNHQAEGHTVRSTDGFLATAAKRRADTHRQRALDELATQPDLTPDQLAEILDPACGPDDGGQARADAAYAATQAWIAEQDAARAEATPPPPGWRDHIGTPTPAKARP